MVSAWYPYSAFVALVHAVEKRQGRGTDFALWLEGLGDALGAVEMTCRQTRCVHRGDPPCEYLGEWTTQRGLFR